METCEICGKQFAEYWQFVGHWSDERFEHYKEMNDRWMRNFVLEQLVN